MRKITTTLFALSLSTSCFADASKFTLQSASLKDGKPMGLQQEFNSFGCKGGNLSPTFHWSGVPEGTKSFALTVYDPDAPTGSGWWHWLVFNIPADTRSLPGSINASGKGLPPGAIQSRTDFGTAGFGGACPPKGDKPHHYQFTLHALKIDKLDLTADTMPAMVGFMLHTHSLGQARLTATYQRD